MTRYLAPIKEMEFILKEIWQYDRFWQSYSQFQDINADLIIDILKQAAIFCEKELLPLNQSGDDEGCKLIDGQVHTPKGFKEAYKKLVEQGWLSLNIGTEFGGQGLPKITQVFFDEILASCNVSFSLYTVLTQGAYHTIKLFADTKLKNIILPKLASGVWSGTMCLTEAHSGTDLGLLKTKAKRQANGSYQISGTKIFITSGDHDLSENIIHMVLARIEGAPDGVKGISMFIVPKFLFDNQGKITVQNHLHCGGIEHKMGIRASSTCVMHFENAQGFLIGEENHGLTAMFSMMNLERINISLEGLALAEVALQSATDYATERLQGRALSGVKFPEKNADPLIVHPDVRRMIYEIKSFTVAARALAAWAAMLSDIIAVETNEKVKQDAEELIGVFTPVMKAYFTDYGFYACNLGLQVFGGHGYIKEYGMEQLVRDARIAQIYEGANGIQALDLVKRKLVHNRGRGINLLSEKISAFITENKNHPQCAEMIETLTLYLADLVEISEWIMNRAAENPDIIGAVSYDYLQYVALVIFAFLWAKIAIVASTKLSESFYASKMQTAKFFYQKQLVMLQGMKQKIFAGLEPLEWLE